MSNPKLHLSSLTQSKSQLALLIKTPASSTPLLPPSLILERERERYLERECVCVLPINLEFKCKSTNFNKEKRDNNSGDQELARPFYMLDHKTWLISIKLRQVDANYLFPCLSCPFCTFLVDKMYLFLLVFSMSQLIFGFRYISTSILYVYPPYKKLLSLIVIHTLFLPF